MYSSTVAFVRLHVVYNITFIFLHHICCSRQNVKVWPIDPFCFRSFKAFRSHTKITLANYTQHHVWYAIYDRILLGHSDKLELLFLSVYSLHVVCLAQLFILYFRRDVLTSDLTFSLVFAGYGGFPPGVPPPTNV